MLYRVAARHERKEAARRQLRLGAQQVRQVDLVDVAGTDVFGDALVRTAVGLVGARGSKRHGLEGRGLWRPRQRSRGPLPSVLQLLQEALVSRADRPAACGISRQPAVIRQPAEIGRQWPRLGDPRQAEQVLSELVGEEAEQQPPACLLLAHELQELRPGALSIAPAALQQRCWLPRQRVCEAVTFMPREQREPPDAGRQRTKQL